jgi:hypothetical protein
VNLSNVFLVRLPNNNNNNKQHDFEGTGYKSSVQLFVPRATRQHVLPIAQQLYRVLRVKISIKPDDGPLGSKQFAINTTNKTVLKTYANLI